MGEAIAYCHADLFSPSAFKRRKIDAPEMPGGISFKRFQNKARADGVGHTRFDYAIGPQVTD
jgi:hypothetical protein